MDLSQSSGWTPEEFAEAFRASILQHVRAGWTWDPPWLRKEISWIEPDERDSRKTVVRRAKLEARPTAVMRRKTPADRDFNPRKDAFALRLGATFIEVGPWRGQYEFGNLVMRHDGSLLDTEACPECQGEPWMVQIRDVRDLSTRPRQVFTYCRSCIAPEEVEEMKARQQELAAMPVKQRKRLRAPALHERR